jgi:hypothetical protein
MTGANMIGKTHFKDDVDITVEKELQKRAKDKKVQEKLDLVDAFGADTFADKTVVRFDKRFNADEKTYSYVAIKAGGYWYTSGGKCYTWEQFLSFLVAGDFPVTSLIPMRDDDGVQESPFRDTEPGTASSPVL